MKHKQNAAILESLKGYKQNAVNNVLSADEKSLLMSLVIKAIAPPLEAVICEPTSEDEFANIDSFANCSDKQLSEYGDKFGSRFSDVAMSIGVQLGHWMHKNSISAPNESQLNKFCEEHDYPPMLFNKAIVLCHMFATQLLNDGFDPIPVILNVDKLLSCAEHNLNAIVVTSSMTYKSLLSDE